MTLNHGTPSRNHSYQLPRRPSPRSITAYTDSIPPGSFIFISLPYQFINSSHLWALNHNQDRRGEFSSKKAFPVLYTLYVSSLRRFMLLHISFASKTEHSVSCVITGQIFGIKADDLIQQATSSLIKSRLYILPISDSQIFIFLNHQLVDLDRLQAFTYTAQRKSWHSTE